VANTQITGNIISSQITSVANTQITGNIASSQITSNPTLYGNVSVTGVIGVGGATPTSNGSGITFPATQSASSNANTLDDYEEGTWTPTITSGSGSITAYVVDNAAYVKIGYTVYISMQITITTVGTASGPMNYTLPFTSAGYQNAVYGREFAVSGYGIQGRINANLASGDAYSTTASNANLFVGGSGLQVTINGFFKNING